MKFRTIRVDRLFTFYNKTDLEQRKHDQTFADLMMISATLTLVLVGTSTCFKFIEGVQYCCASNASFLDLTYERSLILGYAYLP